MPVLSIIIIIIIVVVVVVIIIISFYLTSCWIGEATFGQGPSASVNCEQERTSPRGFYATLPPLDEDQFHETSGRA
ncbi:hypothetical protein LX32DRAFT_694837 [Colletotrichum zoysiae]|uniref:Uncharacterized protein n=1 Tax=Colletotrichum zoysiae TaxID=1216348 RepID=A0AAD9HG42_9PEZI|nr:hypothetical protein LX32DRAFT_694837 [Colletotrichum zoysiae]